jgi:hypothetical protein
MAVIFEVRGGQENSSANCVMCIGSCAERLDPREPNWKMLPKMSAGRGCHTLTVLNEKM